MVPGSTPGERTGSHIEKCFFQSNIQLLASHARIVIEIDELRVKIFKIVFFPVFDIHFGFAINEGMHANFLSCGGLRKQNIPHFADNAAVDLFRLIIMFPSFYIFDPGFFGRTFSDAIGDREWIKSTRLYFPPRAFLVFLF